MDEREVNELEVRKLLAFVGKNESTYLIKRRMTEGGKAGRVGLLIRMGTLNKNLGTSKRMQKLSVLAESQDA